MNRYYIRLACTNSRKNELAKVFNFTTQTNIAASDVQNIISRFVKSNYTYSINKGWKFSKTAKILTFEEAIIAVRDFRFIESQKAPWIVEGTKEVLCSAYIGNITAITSFKSDNYSFFSISVGASFADFNKVKELFDSVNIPLRKSKTEGTWYTNRNISVSCRNELGKCKLVITKETPTDIKYINTHVVL